jgi:hypothetical protein
MTIQEKMAELTHVVEYNPNCHKRFKVRLCGSHYRIDFLPDRASKDVIGYGDTFEEAAGAALSKSPRLKHAK